MNLMHHDGQNQPYPHPAGSSKALDDAINAMRSAWEACPGDNPDQIKARDFAVYKALRRGVAFLGQFDDQGAIDHCLAMAVQRFGLDTDTAQHAANEGLKEGERERDERGIITPKPELVIHSGNLPGTAAALRDLLVASEKFFDRGMPVRIIIPADGGPPSVIRLTPHRVVIEAHELCQPVKLIDDGRVAATLPERVARMYLDMAGDWNLPPLTGITTAPLLADDGGIRWAQGYDRATGLWCCDVPKLVIPERPTRAMADAALLVLRNAFCSFPFADAPRSRDESRGVDSVDISKPPGQDESAFLLALVSAVCRPSLSLTPGFLITAPALRRRHWQGLAGPRCLFHRLRH
jgi:hypothetical protein